MADSLGQGVWASTSSAPPALLSHLGIRLPCVSVLRRATPRYSTKLDDDGCCGVRGSRMGMNWGMGQKLLMALNDTR